MQGVALTFCPTATGGAATAETPMKAKAGRPAVRARNHEHPIAVLSKHENRVGWQATALRQTPPPPAKES